MTSDSTEPDEQGETSIEDCFGLVGVRLEGRFQVESVVAEGGFGVIYRATHITLEKVVALKVLRLAPDLPWPLRTQMLSKFAQEARTVAKFEHPAVVRILDFGASTMPNGEAAPWMAMEWLAGTTLEQALVTRSLPAFGAPETVLELMRPGLEALAAAHDEGIVHRDIKPANMMLVPSRGGVTLKLLDFGIAKRMEPEASAPSGMTSTRSQVSAFTLLYAAPEQVSGMRTGPWTDVHAMALVWTEILVGRTAYPGTNPGAVHESIVSPIRPTPAAHGVDAGAWEFVLAKALSRNPSERYQNAGELLKALETAIPVVSPLPTADTRQTTQWLPGTQPATTLRTAAIATTIIARRPGPSHGPQVMMGVLLGTLTVVIALGAWQLIRSQRDVPVRGASLANTHPQRSLGDPTATVPGVVEMQARPTPIPRGVLHVIVANDGGATPRIPSIPNPRQILAPARPAVSPSARPALRRRQRAGPDYVPID